MNSSHGKFGKAVKKSNKKVVATNVTPAVFSDVKVDVKVAFASSRF